MTAEQNSVVASEKLSTTFEFFHMHLSGDKYYLEPRNLDDSQIEIEENCLVIERPNAELSVQPANSIPQMLEVKQVYGIFGIIRLITGPHVIAITNRFKVGHLNNEPIYRVADMEIIPCTTSIQQATQAETNENQVYLSMVQTVLELNSYYFSPTYDVTHSLHRLQTAKPQFFAKSLIARAEQRFVWNGFMMSSFVALPEAHSYAMPVMLGYVGFSNCEIAGHQFLLALISRRSCLNAGVRFQRRGIDEQGNAANYVETEQIVEYRDAMTSYVQVYLSLGVGQIRGSIPVFWTQKPNLNWMPMPIVERDENKNMAGFTDHVNAQKSKYRTVHFVNLVNNNGYEKVMRYSLDSKCQNLMDNHVKLLNFDFNQKWNHLDELIGFMDQWIIEYGYFCARRVSEKEIRQIKRQLGVFRTSCMDCLDRTNVIQSMVAKKSVEYQFRFLQILTDTDSINDFAEFIWIFRNMWSDNGDALSKQYAGTGALKSDFTRCGKRTIGGYINDGKKAVTRYFINNFYDGFRQDSIDFCLGKCVVDEASPTALGLCKWETKDYLYLAIATMVFLSIFFWLFIPELDEFFFSGLIILLAYTVVNGEKYVNNPRFI